MALLIKSGSEQIRAARMVCCGFGLWPGQGQERQIPHPQEVPGKQPWQGGVMVEPPAGFDFWL